MPDETNHTQHGVNVVFYGDLHSALYRANQWLIQSEVCIRSLYFAFDKLTLFIR